MLSATIEEGAVSKGHSFHLGDIPGSKPTLCASFSLTPVIDMNWFIIAFCWVLGGMMASRPLFQAVVYGGR